MALIGHRRERAKSHARKAETPNPLSTEATNTFKIAKNRLHVNEKSFILANCFAWVNGVVAALIVCMTILRVSATQQAWQTVRPSSSCHPSFGPQSFPIGCPQSAQSIGIPVPGLFVGIFAFSRRRLTNRWNQPRLALAGCSITSFTLISFLVRVGSAPR